MRVICMIYFVIRRYKKRVKKLHRAWLWNERWNLALEEAFEAPEEFEGIFLTPLTTIPWKAVSKIIFLEQKQHRFSKPTYHIYCNTFPYTLIDLLTAIMYIPVLMAA